ncbi:OprO/OprP family phosphate-selective porin [Mucilaginibacter sp. X4EP1]|uniref:OprO/OprP family phosphate-selective porin n=1 Tax=Mucilaginibacter sp. X4EP1 TaxID=2723092 RepID=UPI00216747D4|nr:OprO/OprP family phosphate-selective porin [Mucilaginibacter sp. X4EP1]MCS3814844.1 phosphate-selective porin [Mucilaginibacter sp. X4EP1]
MKLPYVIRTVLVLSILFSALITKAQQNDDLLNVLIKKGVLTQQEADSVRADQALKEQKKKDKEKENQHGITIGSRALQISGLIQTEYEGFQQTGVNNTFLLHRARLDVKGDINDNWNYEVYTEFAGTTKLLDAYTTYKIADYLKFTAGQFKIPFSLESLIADSQLDFIDRSQVVNALAARSTDVIGNQNGRDIGIQINGSFAKVDGRYLFDYTLGVFNGAGYDVTTDNNSHKDIAGRFSVHPINNLIVSADFYDGQGNYGTPAKNYLRNRGGFDARYVIGGLALQAEYDKGTDGIIKRDGWYGQATYFVLPNRLQLAAKYDTYDPNEISKNVKTNDYTGGVNFFFNNWARLAVDYVDRREEVTQIKNNIFEAQLQLTF